MNRLHSLILHRLKMKMNNPFTTSFGTVVEKDFFVVELIDDEGIRGFGETVAFTTPWYTEETTETVFHILERFLIPLFQQATIRHPKDLSTLFAPIKRNNMAKSAIEGAVWDLYAKQQNRPLSVILGGVRKKIPVGISLGIERNIDRLLEKITHYVEQGYKRVKIKIKRTKDLDVLHEVRRHFPDLPLMVDANSSYTLADIAHLRQFDQFNLMMIEQPLADNDILDHATLQREIKTPICLDESIHSFKDVQLATELQSCKIINVKAGRIGGLYEAVKMHDYCKRHNIDLWCGGMLDSGVGRAHNIALASLEHFTLPGDIGSSSHYWAKDIIFPEVYVVDGNITVPNRPGIGYELDFEAMENYRIAKHEYIL